MFVNTTQHLKDTQSSHCQNFIVLRNLSTWLSFVSTPNYSNYPFLLHSWTARAPATCLSTVVFSLRLFQNLPEHNERRDSGQQPARLARSANDAIRRDAGLFLSASPGASTATGTGSYPIMPQPLAPAHTHPLFKP